MGQRTHLPEFALARGFALLLAIRCISSCSSWFCICGVLGIVLILSYLHILLIGRRLGSFACSIHIGPGHWLLGRYSAPHSVCNTLSLGRLSDFPETEKIGNHL